MKYDKELDKLLAEERELIFEDFKDDRRVRLNKHIVELHLLQIRDTGETQNPTLYKYSKDRIK